MKRIFTLFIVLILLVACNPIVFDLNTDESPSESIQDTEEPINEINLDEEIESTEELIQDTDCYEDGIHPIALSIADEYNELTDYSEVMLWFCNGAEFEDILNALITEEIIEVEPEWLLRRIAEGVTWNDIWLELGIIEE